jgi:hypothetical protein
VGGGEDGSSALVRSGIMDDEEAMLQQWPLSVWLLHALLYCRCRRNYSRQRSSISEGQKGRRRLVPRGALLFVIWGAIAGYFFYHGIMQLLVGTGASALPTTVHDEGKRAYRSLMASTGAANLAGGLEVVVNAVFCVGYFAQQVSSSKCLCRTYVICCCVGRIVAERGRGARGDRGLGGGALGAE